MEPAGREGRGFGAKRHPDEPVRDGTNRVAPNRCKLNLALSRLDDGSALFQLVPILCLPVLMVEPIVRDPPRERPNRGRTFESSRPEHSALYRLKGGLIESPSHTDGSNHCRFENLAKSWSKVASRQLFSIATAAMEASLTRLPVARALSIR